MFEDAFFAEGWPYFILLNYDISPLSDLYNMTSVFTVGNLQ